MFDFATVPRHRFMKRTENHLYLRPHPMLAGAVAHYTITFPARMWSAGSDVQKGAQACPSITLLPDVSGCLVLNMDEGMHGYLWGATTRAVVLKSDFETVPMRFFVEFLPGGGYQLFGDSLVQMADQRLPAADVLPVLYDSMVEIVQNSMNIGWILDKIDSILLGFLSRSDSKLISGLLAMVRHKRANSVKEIAEHVGYSVRHLDRLFNTMIGVPVKTCTKVFRVNRFVSGLVPGKSLAGLAQNAGYYDQPHLNHDFKAVCGVTPGEYLAGMSGFYMEEFKF